jgi:xanthine/uracil permease
MIKKRRQPMSEQTLTDGRSTVDPVNECPPAGRLFTLALQHVLVMYAGAIAVPLIIGGALKLPKDQIAFLINADLLTCGLVTIIQSLGVGPMVAPTFFHKMSAAQQCRPAPQGLSRITLI